MAVDKNRRQIRFIVKVVVFWFVLITINIGSFSMSAALAARRNIEGDDCWRVVVKCDDLGLKSELPDRYGDSPYGELTKTDYAHFITYRIEYRGSLELDTDTLEFINQVAETLSDSRGWARAGYVFKRVQQSSNADFTLALTQAEVLDTIPGCSSQWSCRSGALVLINEDRWKHATDSWNHAGGSLRDYRHMVVNHEVGHWLGLGHANCSQGEDNLAPVMLQQSIDLQGCKFNPWPLDSEIGLLL